MSDRWPTFAVWRQRSTSLRRQRRLASPTVRNARRSAAISSGGTSSSSNNNSADLAASSRSIIIVIAPISHCPLCHPSSDATDSSWPASRRLTYGATSSRRCSWVRPRQPRPAVPPTTTTTTTGVRTPVLDCSTGTRWCTSTASPEPRVAPTAERTTPARDRKWSVAALASAPRRPDLQPQPSPPTHRL